MDRHTGIRGSPRRQHASIDRAVESSPTRGKRFSEVSAVESDLEDALARIAALEGVKVALEAALSDASEEESVVSQKLEQQKEIASCLSDQFDALTSTHSTLEKQHSVLQRAHAALQVEHSDLQADFADVRRISELQATEIIQLQKENHKLRFEEDTLASRKEALRTERATLMEEISRCHTQLDSAEAVYATLRRAGLTPVEQLEAPSYELTSATIAILREQLERNATAALGNLGDTGSTVFDFESVSDVAQKIENNQELCGKIHDIMLSATGLTSSNSTDPIVSAATASVQHALEKENIDPAIAKAVPMALRLCAPVVRDGSEQHPGMASLISLAKLIVSLDIDADSIDAESLTRLRTALAPLLYAHTGRIACVRRGMGFSRASTVIAAASSGPGAAFLTSCKNGIPPDVAATLQSLGLGDFATAAMGMASSAGTADTQISASPATLAGTMSGIAGEMAGTAGTMAGTMTSVLTGTTDIASHDVAALEAVLHETAAASHADRIDLLESILIRSASATPKTETERPQTDSFTQYMDDSPYMDTNRELIESSSSTACIDATESTAAQPPAVFDPGCVDLD